MGASARGRLNLFELTPNPKDCLVGIVHATTPLQYEVFGPFGQGYNIRVVGKGGTALLEYHWREGPGAGVTTPMGRYGISENSGHDEKGAKIVQLKDNEVITESDDELLLAVFSVNHHFWLKTGPFAPSKLA